MAKPGKAAQEETEAAAKPKSKRLLLALVAVLLLGAIGGGAWYFFKHHKPSAPKAVVVKPAFMELDPFTVNLQREESEQFLQVRITLKISNEKLEDEIKLVMPEIRSRLLFLLSSKRPSELMPIEGKKKLAQEIAAAANAVLASHSLLEGGSEALAAASAPEAASATAEAAPAEKGGSVKGRVLEVLFTSFIIQ